MTTIQANNITLEYEETGAVQNEPLVLIRGLGTQLTNWSQAFIQGLAAQGFRVIYFDNRDVGLSEKFESAGMPDLLAIAQGNLPLAAYTLDDMAADVIGLMDALQIQKTHIMGISMGGMIVQLLAGNYPDRILSMTAIMSSSGNPALPPLTPEAQQALMSQPENPDDRQSIIAHKVKILKFVESPGYPSIEEARLEEATTSYERSYYPMGVARQMAAIFASGSRVELLKTIQTPSLVIHGEADPLLPVVCSEDIAKHILQARLVTIPGMGHDMPEALNEHYISLITEHARIAQ